MSRSHRQVESSGRGCEDAAVELAEKVEVAHGYRTGAWVVQVMHSVEGVILAAAKRLLPVPEAEVSAPPLRRVRLPLHR